MVCVPLPAQNVIAIVLDPDVDEELRYTGERVLVSLGFENGSYDLELTGNDYNLLVDWFFFERSLQVQTHASNLIKQQIKATFASNQLPSLSGGGGGGDGAGRAFSFNKDSSSAESLGGMSGSGSGGGSSVVGRAHSSDSIGHSMSGLGLASSPTSLAGGDRPLSPLGSMGMGSPSFFSHGGGGKQQLLSPAMVHAETVRRDEARFERVYDKWRELSVRRSGEVPPDESSGVGRMGIPRLSSREQRGSGFDNILNMLTCRKSPSLEDVGGLAAGAVGGFADYLEPAGVGSLPMQRVLSSSSRGSSDGHDRPMSPSSLVSPVSGHSGHVGAAGLSATLATSELVYPRRIEMLLDWYFPSRLEQKVFTDLAAYDEVVSSAASASSGSRICSNGKLPRPRQFRCISLPVRTYLTFQRVGRVIEKLLQRNRKTYSDVAGSSNLGYNTMSARKAAGGDVGIPGGGSLPPGISYSDHFDVDTYWSLCFRDCTFMGDFYVSFLKWMRRCPNLVSLSFVFDQNYWSHMALLERETCATALGHLVGEVAAIITPT